MNNINYSFQHTLNNLNPDQLKAVNQTEGPVMVIAGPGTGKTQILSARIGNILNTRELHTAAHNILCLTFTEAGTINMRQRLYEIIGAEAYRVNIYTFHAFCNDIIQKNRDYFNVWNFQPLSDLEEIDLYYQLIDNFKADNPLKRYTGEVYFEIDRLKNLFKTMKGENWSPDFICRKVDEYIDDLPNREGFFFKRANRKKGVKAGDPNENKIRQEKDRMEKLKAATREFDNYNKLLHESRRYDYHDMINWVLEAFSNDDGLLADYQEQYLYFLVDEYQDTNGAQNEILRLLNSFWDNPNLFVVGDDDQSIYRFQGANVLNMHEFYQRYQPYGLTTIMMRENYRSSQPVLDTAKALIDNNDERLVNIISNLDKTLTANNDELKKENKPPTLKAFYNTHHQEAGIVKEIESLYHQNQDLSEIAIIYRSHRNIENIVKVLEYKGIPFNARLQVNILTLPFANNMINILRYVGNELQKIDSGEYLLFEIMHYSWFNIPHRDIAIISRYCANQRIPWRNLTGNKEKLAELGIQKTDQIIALEENLTYWTQKFHEMTLQELFEKILNNGGIMEYVMKDEEKIWKLQIINTLFNFIKEETAKNPKLSLNELLSMIDKMNANSIPLNINRIIQAENGVNLLTAHASKGLEFEHVYIIHAVASNWERKKSPLNQFRLPDTIIPSVETNKTEEERRLFYVAMTRAKRTLTITYPELDQNEKPLDTSAFVAEINESGIPQTQHVELKEEDIINYTYESIAGESNIPSEFVEEEFIKETLKDYKLSVTHLNKYLRSPLAFYFENILRVPEARNKYMGFGNAIHHALEQLFANMLKSENKEFPPKESFLHYFKEAMQQYASHFTNKDYELLMEYGEQNLPEYYESYHDYWNRVVSLEYKFSNVEMEGIPLSGQLDKIEFDGNEANVVDYKTGNPKNAKDRLEPPNEKNEIGGDYWRQLVFYKILMDEDKTKTWNMISGEVDFIQKNTQKNIFEKFKYYVKEEDIKIVKQQIRETWDNIMNHRFFEEPRDKECRWYKFVQENYQNLQKSIEEEI